MKSRSKFLLQVHSTQRGCKKGSQLKFIIPIVTVFIVFASSSCDKSPINDSLLTGKWSIVNDSTLLQGAGALQTSIHSNYIGVPTDYFNITSNGNIYVKEGANLDTLSYTYASTTKINIIGYYVNGTTYPDGASLGTYVISGLTNNSVTLNLSETTPDGTETEIINLKK